MRPLFTIKQAFGAAIFTIFSVGGLQATSLYDVSTTNHNTLNDLIRKIPATSYVKERELRQLSALQELLLLHEQRMRGEGLPPLMAKAFSINYSAIIKALINDEITEEYGRDLLSLHRQMLERSYRWAESRNRDETFPEQLVNNIHHFLSEMETKKTPVYQVPESVRTPLINGYQIWAGELLAWGCECGGLSPGQRTRIQNSLDHLERFECLYKKDGKLMANERKDLHGRLIRLSRKTIEELRR